MMITMIEAVYENGVLRPTRPLRLREGQHVELTLVPKENDEAALLTDAEFTTLASEVALGRIWNDPVEDAAWAHL